MHAGAVVVEEVVGVDAFVDVVVWVVVVEVVLVRGERRLRFRSLCAFLIYLDIAGRLSTCLPIAFHIFLS